MSWRTAESVGLLSGDTHPGARFKSEWIYAHGTALAESFVEARNSVEFKSTSYMGQQDGETAFHQLMMYYRALIRTIPPWNPHTQTTPKVKKELTDDGTPASASTSANEANPSTKEEEEVEDAGNAQQSSATSPIGSMYQGVGILTKLHDPSAMGDELLAPWEFFPIEDLEDDDAFIAVLHALFDENVVGGNIAGTGRNSTSGGSGSKAAFFDAMVSNAALSGASPFGATDESPATRSVESNRISLYARLVPRYTGLYRGIPVRVVGEPFRRSTAGALTAVLLRSVLLPSRPQLPWSISRPLVRDGLPPSLPTRVHFCSGPFPRHSIRELIVAATNQALLREADVLIIGGPLVDAYQDFEKDILQHGSVTFEELLGTLMDAVEDTLATYAKQSEGGATSWQQRGAQKWRGRLKVVLVPHRDDVTQIPVLPITMYALQDGDDVWVRSNPCRICVNGVHFGVCNDDVVGGMRDRLVEKWPTPQGSLRRVTEAIVRSRLYTPIYELPAPHVDLKHLNRLCLGWNPPSSGGGISSSTMNAILPRGSIWDLARVLHDEYHQSGTSAGGGNKREPRISFEISVKKEEEQRESVARSDNELNDPHGMHSPVEDMPHVLFLPSTRPQFAFNTRIDGEDVIESDVQNSSASTDANAAASSGDGRGVLVVNQGLHDSRVKKEFQLAVAEVTIADSNLVVQHGASMKTGTICAILYIYRN